MAEKQKTKPTEKLEREYVIPLRTYWKRVPRYKRANRAIKGIKEFLVQHMKMRDRDLNKVKLDKFLNEQIWVRGIKKPPVKIKVKAIKQDNIVRVELADMPDRLKFKKKRFEKIEADAQEALEKKKSFMEKAKEGLQPGQSTSETPVPESEEKKEEEQEKKSAVVEAGAKMEKAAAKKTKHQSVGKAKQPKRPQRKSLAK